MGLLNAERHELDWEGETVPYYVAGSGPPVVLLHGLGGAAVVWYQNLPVLAERYRVYVPELWGPERYEAHQRLTPDLGIRFLTGFMDGVGADHAHVAGVSLGGLIAGFTAAQNPERITSLTLIDSAGFGREIAWSQRLLAQPLIGELFMRASASAVRRMMQMLLRRPSTVSKALVQELADYRRQPGVMPQMLKVLRSGVGLRGVKRSMMLLDRMRHLKTPSLVVWGQQDPLLPVAHAHTAANAIPGARLHIVEGAGHWPYLEKPEEVNPVLLDFLGSADNGKRSVS